MGKIIVRTPSQMRDGVDMDLKLGSSTLTSKGVQIRFDN